MKLKTSWRKILLFLFGMSMFASLVYQVTWTRYLSLVFGTTVFALSAVLTSFMAGLAIGSYYFGRKIDKTKNALELFAKMEIALGVYALLLIPLFKLIQYPYFFLYNLLGSTYLINIALFVLAFLILIVPTIIIGATFPIVSKIYSDNIDKDISDVYSTDVIFGALGAFTAGFYFLPYWGLFQTELLAAAINLLIGYIFYRRCQK